MKGHGKSRWNPPPGEVPSRLELIGNGCGARLLSMKRKVSLPSITKRVQGGFKLPAPFDAFVRTAAAADQAESPWFSVTWTNPTTFDLKREAARELLPFLRLGDGGAVAFWLGAPKGVPIVHFDSEGEKRVVAASFADFLRLLAQRRTGVEDLDDRSDGKAAIAVRGFTPKSSGRAPAQSRAALRPLAKAYARWCDAFSALQKPTRTADAESLRRRLVAAARKMLRDGRSKVHGPRASEWDFDFTLERVGDEVKVKYLDYGEWYLVPPSYGLGPMMAELLRLTKHPNQRRCEVAVTSYGLVSVNKDRELLLEAPGSR